MSNKEDGKKNSDGLLTIILGIVEVVGIILSIIKDGYWVIDLAIVIFFGLVTAAIMAKITTKGKFSKFFTKSWFIVFQVIWLIIAIFISVNFILRPSAISSLRDYFTDSGGFSNTSSITQTPSIFNVTTPTPTFIRVPSTTPTLQPSLTPTPTPTIKYPEIRVGIFDLGEGCINPEILERMSKLGFVVELISFNMTFDDMKEFDILYLSEGWYCKWQDVEKLNQELKEFMQNYGGLFIGNPKVSRLNYESSLLNFEINYLPSDYTSEDWPAYKNCNACNTHYIIFNLEENEFPIPESIMVLPSGPYIVLTRGKTSSYPSLVIPSNNSRYNFVLMPGSESSNSRSNVSDDLLERIILYLSGKHETEWYE